MIATNFMSSKDTEERVMHSKSGNTEIKIGDEANEVIGKLFESLLSRYQIGLTESMIKGTDFVFVDSLYYKCRNINPNRSESHVDSPDWIKKATINPINKHDNKCFQYAATVALHHKEIGKKKSEYSILNLLFVNIIGKE